jgi:hypothetical protein
MIYGYALTEEGGLVADVDSKVNTWIRFRAADNDDHTHESNQLRFVCCQLHVETSALSLRYNDLTFGWRSYRFHTVYDMFDRFYETCAPSHLDDIRRITILDHETSVPEDKVYLPELLSPSLVEFCRRSASVTVLVRFNWLDDSEWAETIDSMIFLSKALQRPHPFPSERGSYLGGSIVDEMVTQFSGVKCPNNLRFTCTHRLDERLATANLDGIFDSLTVEGEGAKCDYEKWMEIARRVHENGI